MTWNGIPIKVDFVYPPIPIRTMDYSATLDDGRCQCPECGSGAVGWGKSSNIAVADLIQQLWECGA